MHRIGHFEGGASGSFFTIHKYSPICRQTPILIIYFKNLLQQKYKSFLTRLQLPICLPKSLNRSDLCTVSAC